MISLLNASQEFRKLFLFSKDFFGIVKGSHNGLPYVATGVTSESKSEKILSTSIRLFLNMMLLMPNHALLALSFNSWTARECDVTLTLSGVETRRYSITY